MTVHDPDFCLFPGDLVLGGFVNNQTFSRQLRIWMDAASIFKRPIYALPGNHEMRHYPQRDIAWRAMFPELPSNGPTEGPQAGNYFFDYQGSRFISVLSDYEDGHSGVDQGWLDTVLDSSAGFKHIFVMSHHPMQQLGGAEGEFWKSLRRHRVDAYFCGHWHFYNRSQPKGSGPWQIVTGTAGAPPVSHFPTWLLNGTTETGTFGFCMVKVDDSSVEVAFYGNRQGRETSSKPIDRFVISAETRENPDDYSEIKDYILELLTRASGDNQATLSERRHNRNNFFPHGDPY